MIEGRDEQSPTTEEPGRVDRMKERAARLRAEWLATLETQRERHRSVRTAFDFYQRDQAFAGSLLAGGIAVKLFVWFLPYALTLVVLVGSIADNVDQPPEDLASSVGLGASLAALVADAVATSSRARIYLAVLGVILLLWAGMGVTRAIWLVSRLAWALPRRPGNRLLGSLAVTGAVTALLLMQRVIHVSLGGPLPLDVLVIVVEMSLTVGMLAWFLHFLPRPPEVPWTAMLPGAALLTLGLIITRLVTIVYFGPRLASAGDLYGGLGMAAVFLAWLYIIARVTVAAISLNATVWMSAHPRAPDLGSVDFDTHQGDLS